MLYFRIKADNRGIMPRPVVADSVDSARRRVLAAHGLELEGISRAEFERMEAQSVTKGHGPAISEACEVGEEMSPDAPCSGNVDGCTLRHRCPRWLERAQGAAS